MIPHADLKAKHRQLRDGWPQPLSLRVHRALSWLGRAEQESEDIDIRFILLWVGFNATYAADISGRDPSERDAFRHFFMALCDLDDQQRIYASVWERFPHEIRLLLDNRFVFSPFWRHANGDAAFADWDRRLKASKREVNLALAHRNTPLLLEILFDRLYTLRNQLVHGGATWNGRLNRDQLRDGTAILASLLPLFLDVMMDNPQTDWGRPYYPVVD